jgi:hypothetical protein
VGGHRTAGVVLATPWLDSALERVSRDGTAPPELAALDWCLRRSTIASTATDDWRSWLLHTVPGGAALIESHPAGPVLRDVMAKVSPDRVATWPGFSPQSWACARPLHLRAATDHVWLESELHPPLSAPECAELVAALNELLAESGCALIALDSREWLFASRESIEVRSWSPELAEGRAIRETLPTGRDARAVRSRMNEMQMLLHAHGCNQHRESLGQQTANAIWLWGFGAASALATPTELLPSLASDDDGLRHLWRLYAGRLESPRALLASATPTQLLLISASRPQDEADPATRLRTSELELFVPLRAALIERRIRSVEWLTGTSIRRLADRGAWFTWRRWLDRG